MLLPVRLLLIFHSVPRTSGAFRRQYANDGIVHGLTWHIISRADMSTRSVLLYCMESVTLYYSKLRRDSGWWWSISRFSTQAFRTNTKHLRPWGPTPFILSKNFSHWGLGLILDFTFMHTSLLTPMSVHSLLIPGNTHAFREAHPKCSLPQRNPTDGNGTQTPTWLRIGLCPLVI